MAKKSKDETSKSIKSAFDAVKGERTTGWEADDSANLGIALVKAQTDAEGKPIKFTKEADARMAAAMAITPRRIVAICKNEVKNAGCEMDETTEAFLLRLFDLPKFRKELVDAKLIDQGSKGKKKAAPLADILK